MVLESLQVELTVILGKTRLPLHKLLRMGRGAVISLDPDEPDRVDILANGLLVAHGKITVNDGAISVEVTDLVRKSEVTRTRGATIGGKIKGVHAPAEPA